MNIEELQNGGVLTVMYHYVRDNNTENTPNLKSLDIKKFKSQLNWLCKHFKPLSMNDYFTCIDKKIPFPQGTFMLTFDDGLKDHYNYVYPELKKRGLWGFFFINSKVYQEKIPLEVHMTHFILDKIGSEDFTERVSKRLKDFSIKNVTHNNDNVYRYDDKSYSAIKNMMNYSLDFAIRDKILDEIFHSIFDSKEMFIKSVYASETELKEMHKNGMIIGCHTHAHRVLSRLSIEDQKSDLVRNKKFISDLLDIEHPVFCFPYGHKHTYTKETLKIIEKQGFHSAFNTVRSITNLESNGKYELSRIDTADLVDFH
jgi:peptidoglycan/xylan/chitin deacetylase (PgdA/CDA1 family)